jgi:hypothetical protein
MSCSNSRDSSMQRQARVRSVLRKGNPKYFLNSRDVKRVLF